MPSFFEGSSFEYSNQARELDAEFVALLTPVYKKWVDKGYSPREISYILNSVAAEVEVFSIFDLRDSKKEANK